MKDRIRDIDNKINQVRHYIYQWEEFELDQDIATMKKKIEELAELGEAL